MRSRIAGMALLAAVVLPPIAARAGSITGANGAGQSFGNLQPTIALNYLLRTTGLFSELGEIIMLGSSYAPPGWALAQGQMLAINDNPALFSLLGTTYGGNGTTTFALPDLRGRTPLGDGQAPGLSNRTLGSKTGSETVTLTESQLPAHSHTLPGGGATGITGSGAPVQNMQPSLAMNYVVPLQGIYPPRSFASVTGTPSGSSAVEPFLGSVHLFAGGVVPAGCASADGQLLSISPNTALFSLLGTYYGGDGRTTFALPDLRGRAALHAGTGPGLSTQVLGSALGIEKQSITLNQMPAHRHTLPPSTDKTGSTGGGQPIFNEQPSLALNYMVALQGIYPPQPFAADQLAGESSGANALDPFLGEIAIMASNFAPRGWALADGQVLSIAQNTALFSLYGTTYGGDGITTFALPDLRGRVVVGAGQVPGGTNWLLGQRTGTEFVTLSASQMPSHTHTLPMTTILVGDANGDCSVGAADYALWAAQFGQSGPSLSADFDQNGSVGAGDYALWAANFGHTCPPAANAAGSNVPEPRTAALFGLAMGALAICRWRPWRSV